MNYAEEYLDCALNELHKFRNAVDFEKIDQAAKLIFDRESHGNRTHVTGIGKPSYVAGYIASLLSSTGTKAYTLHGTEAVHGSSGQVEEGDVVIAISNSGQTQELIATIQTLINNGAKIIAVTRNEESWLAQHSDVTLIAKVDQEGDSMNKPPRASILAEMIILQALSVVLQENRGLDPQQYVKWHPGGALGASISNK